MPEQFETKYFRGQGKLLIGDIDANGNPTGLTFVGDLESASLSPNMERSEVIENTSGSGAVGASWLNRSQYNMSLALRSVKPAHLAIALHGTNTIKAGASVTDEAQTCYLDKFTSLENNKISAVTITNVGATVTYVEGTDYIVHADEGMIEFISGGTVTDALAVLIDYAYAAQSHIKINPNNLDKYLVFAGVNTADNDKQTRCEMYKVKLDPGVLSLITPEAANIPINGTLQLAPNRAVGDQLFSWKIEA